ncbi:MAG: GNAT family N-acetyltransferase [Bacteroidota bacterium]
MFAGPLPMTEDRLPQIAALQPPGWTNPVSDLYRRHWPYDYFRPLQITRDQNLVGIGQLIVLPTTAWLGNIIVAPKYRRRGLGRKLTRALLDVAEQTGVATTYLLATPDGEALYADLGFRSVDHYVFYVHPKPPQHYTPAPQVRDYQPAQVKALRDMDRRATGEDRWPVLRHFLAGARAYWEADQVRGFYLPQMGDGLVLAETEVAGTELLQERAWRTGKPHVIVPAANRTAARFLAGEGYAITRRASLMHRGPLKRWEPQEIYGRIGGYLG